MLPKADKVEVAVSELVPTLDPYFKDNEEGLPDDPAVLVRFYRHLEDGTGEVLAMLVSGHETLYRLSVNGAKYMTVHYFDDPDFVEANFLVPN